MLSHSMKIVAAAVLTLVVAAPTSVKVAEVDKRQLSIQYAPIPALCPSTPLVRPASSLNSNEAAYISSRKTKANPALAAWLKKQSPSFSTSSQPVVGLTSSGGGLRALLEVWACGNSNLVCIRLLMFASRTADRGCGTIVRYSRQQRWHEWAVPRPRLPWRSFWCVS